MRSSRFRWCRASAEATFHKPLIFAKFLFVEFAFHNEKAVDMAKQCVVIVDSGDKGDAVSQMAI